jgi:hypothetical protein
MSRDAGVEFFVSLHELIVRARHSAPSLPGRQCTPYKKTQVP